MAVIDERGRVFGRVNMIDAALLLFVLALIPIGVVTSRVFRERTPRIDEIVPASQPAGAGRRIRLKGADFRPYLRLFVNPAGEPFSLQGRKVDDTEATFLIESPNEVEAQLPPLRPGSYDLHLLDETREILARPSAITLTPPPGLTLRATVRFVALGDIAGLLKVGDVDLADPAPAGPAREGARAVIELVGPAASSISAVDTLAGKGGRTVSVVSPARAVEVRLAVPAARNSQGIWTYRDLPVRPGDAFGFETANYSVHGVVTAVSAGDRAPDAPLELKGAKP